jgi:ABC-type uncharacterized transport system auxiliary subunit
MGRRYFVVLMLILMVCPVCSTVPENHYFTMAYVLLPSKTIKTYPATLRIRQLDIIPAYDRERIVYRYSPYEFRYYNYMLWAAKPQVMLTNLLARHIDHSGLFSDVMLEYGERPPDYELLGVVHAVEELDSGDEWYAHLALTIRVVNYQNEKVVLTHEIDTKKRVYNKAPVYVVKALSELMEEEMNKVVIELDKFLQKQVAGSGRAAR